MAAKEIKSFAEYAIRRWLTENGMTEKDFVVLMSGREALVTDSNGDSIRLAYDAVQKTVYQEE